MKQHKSQSRRTKTSDSTAESEKDIKKSPHRVITQLAKLNMPFKRPQSDRGIPGSTVRIFHMPSNFLALLLLLNLKIQKITLNK